MFRTLSRHPRPQRFLGVLGSAKAKTDDRWDRKHLAVVPNLKKLDASVVARSAGKQARCPLDGVPRYREGCIAVEGLKHLVA
jgi:hypothetical protein